MNLERRDKGRTVFALLSTQPQGKATTTQPPATDELHGILELYVFDVPREWAIAPSPTPYKNISGNGLFGI